MRRFCNGGLNRYVRTKTSQRLNSLRSSVRLVNTNSGTDIMSNTRAKITLEDGTVLEGISFGSETPVNGEVVFSI